MIVSAGWYVALVSLWPADSRPYIGGSTDNSLLQLALGYNGIERIAGGDGGPGGGRPGGGGGRRQPVLRWRSGHRPAVRPVVGRRGVLAAAGRADRPGRRAVVHPARAAHRPRPRRPAAVGRLAAGHRRRLQLHGRHHSPVLHRRAGAGDRRAGGDRGARSCGGGRELLAAAGRAGGHAGGHRRLGVRPAGPHSGLAARRCAGSCWPDRSWQRRCSRSACTGWAGPRVVLAIAALLFGARAVRPHTRSRPPRTRTAARCSSPGPAQRLGGAPAGRRTGRTAALAAPRRQRRTGGARRWHRQPLGRSQYRIVDRERSGAQDRRSSWRSADSPVGRLARRWRSSSSTSPTIRCGTSSPATGAARARGSRAAPATSPPGCSRTSRPIDVGGTTVYDLSTPIGR